MRNDEDVFTRGGNRADSLLRLTASQSGGYQIDCAESGQPQRISLAEHERTMGEVVRERDQLLRERVHTAAVLAAFRDAKLSISSVQPILTLADALCGPKETPCPPL